MAQNIYHPTAVVATDHVGPDKHVDAFTRIYPQVHIGWGCRIGNHCLIENDVEVGDRVSIGNGTFVPLKVSIGADVRIGNRVSFLDSAALQRTLATDEPPATRIGAGALIADGAVIRCGVTLGRHASVQPYSRVERDVPDFASVFGKPARQDGWVCACGARLDLPVNGSGEATCSCGVAYALANGVVMQVE